MIDVRRFCRFAPVLGLVLAVVLAGCAVPREREVKTIDKIAATDDDVLAVYTRYREVRNAAIDLLDPKPLSTIEAGATLAIDAGSFEVAQRLSTTREETTGDIEVLDVKTPRFSTYPLWYYSVVRDGSRGVQRVQIFERASAVEPWLLVSTPEALADTTLPSIRSSDGAARRVDTTDGAGMAMSIDEAAGAYVRTLTDPSAPESDTIEDDSFIDQMREAAAVNAGLAGVGFSQEWKAEDVQYALRTSDGGALAFVTLLRTDRYTVDDGLQVTWPAGSPQQAFLADGLQDSGVLNYLHQILVYLPGGKEKPRALGQFGGVVSGDIG